MKVDLSTRHGSLHLPFMRKPGVTLLCDECLHFIVAPSRFELRCGECGSVADFSYLQALSRGITGYVYRDSTPPRLVLTAHQRELIAQGLCPPQARMMLRIHNNT